MEFAMLQILGSSVFIYQITNTWFEKEACTNGRMRAAEFQEPVDADHMLPGVVVILVNRSKRLY